MTDSEGDNHSPDAADIWVLTDVSTGGSDSPEIQQYGGLRKISPEKLGELLEEFTNSLGRALGRVKAFSQDYELNEVSVTASLNGELGFTLVAKAGAEAGITLTFTKKGLS